MPKETKEDLFGNPIDLDEDRQRVQSTLGQHDLDISDLLYQIEKLKDRVTALEEA